MMSGLQWLRIMLLSIVCIGLGSWFARSALDTSRCGIAKSVAGVYRRDKNSFSFWTIVALWVAFAVAMFCSLIVSLRH